MVIEPCSLRAPASQRQASACSKSWWALAKSPRLGLPISSSPSTRKVTPQTCNQVALVIGHTTSIQTTIPDGCLERWYAPGLQRLRRLGIVVVVDGETTRAIAREASHHHRKALGRHQRGLGPQVAQAFRHEVRHFPHSLALRGDTRLAAEAHQVGKR